MTIEEVFKLIKCKKNGYLIKEELISENDIEYISKPTICIWKYLAIKINIDNQIIITTR